MSLRPYPVGIKTWEYSPLIDDKALKNAVLKLPFIMIADSLKRKDVELKREKPKELRT